MVRIRGMLPHSGHLSAYDYLPLRMSCISVHTCPLASAKGKHGWEIAGGKGMRLSIYSPFSFLHGHLRFTILLALSLSQSRKSLPPHALLHAWNGGVVLMAPRYSQGAAISPIHTLVNYVFIKISDFSI